MSTKIYNTLHINDNGQDTLNFINDEKNNIELIREEYVDKVTTKMLKDFKFNLLNYINYKKIVDNKNFDEVFMKIVNSSKLIFDNLSFYNNDFERAYLNTELSFINYNIEMTKIRGTLIQYFGLNGFNIISKLESRHYTKSFDYWNNTDMDIPMDEHALREKTWDIIFHNSDIPSEVGTLIVFYDFINDFHHNQKEIFDLLEKSFFKKIKEVKTEDFKEKIYVKTKMFAEMELSPNELKEDTISKFLNMELKARKALENKIPLTEKEQSLYDYTIEELQRRLNYCNSNENKNNIMSSIKNNITFSVTKTHNNKRDEQKRKEDFDKEMLKLKNKSSM